jgi:anti-sigma factor RsiW
MNCVQLEALLCDYLDGTLPAATRAEVERHLADCPACAQLAADSRAVMELAGRAAEVEPPPELVTRILFELAGEREKAGDRRRGLAGIFGHLLGPVLQPRFAMGMAMTILSLAMLARTAHIDVRQLSLSDLDPVRIWRNVDDRAHRGWTRAVKFYESLRFVYEIRSRLADLGAQEDVSESQSGAAQSGQPAAEPREPGPAK